MSSPLRWPVHIRHADKFAAFGIPVGGATGVLYARHLGSLDK
ncbi:MAG TPA: hypothetical protein PLY87_06300 [Planctomycetaceae bacterium]|nr:hypothetical protein [Planctomycetaceae bacterium]HQZ64664.1 hypothetical protein [Planctomycetaceae bacterium]HRA86846.1 hypothetical protein [Planctomycetaceae bacterium]